MEMPKAYARAAAHASVHGSGSLPVVVQNLSCVDASLAEVSGFLARYQIRDRSLWQTDPVLSK
jgi:hypothetical protein